MSRPYNARPRILARRKTALQWVEAELKSGKNSEGVEHTDARIKVLEKEKSVLTERIAMG